MPTKSLRINICLYGHGVVQNGDKAGEKNLTYKRDDVLGQKHDNITYAKGNYYRNVDGDGKETLTKVLKISGDGLRHAIHAESMGVFTANVLRNTATRLAYYSHLDTLIRGWLHADAGHRNSSGYAVTGAEDKDAVLFMEFCASSEPKTEKETGDPSQASVFTRENTGDTNYKSHVIVDINKLRFLSFSDVYGRRAIADDEAEVFVRLLSRNIGSQVSMPAYYRRRGSAITIPERGILLTDEQVHVLVRHLLRGIANIQIVKSATGFARTKSVEMCAITNDVAPGHYSYIPMYTEDTGLAEDKIPTQYDNVWELVNEEEALVELQAVEADVQRYKQEAREREAARKAIAEERKTKKDKKSTAGADED